MKMKKRLKILILEDDPSDAELIKLELKKTNRQFESRVVQDEENFLKELDVFQPDLILSDYSMPQFTGLEALEIAKKRCPEIPFIIVTGSVNEETAVKCIRLGAWDYVLKDKLVHLGHAVTNAIKLKEENEKKKLAEEVLKANEERYRVLFETAKDAIYITDETGKFINVNQTACKSLGYSKEELLTMYNKDLDAESTGYEAFKKVRNGLKEDVTFEVNQIRKDGTLLPVEITGNYYTIGDKKLSLTIARDITKRKQAEETLKKSEHEKSLIMDNMSELIVYRNKDMETIWASKSVSKFLNITPKENIGRVCYKERYNRDTICPDCKVMQVFKTGNPHQREDTSPDGRCWDVRCSVVRNESGKIIGTIEVSMDITARKQVEEALRTSEQQYRTLTENVSIGIYRNSAGVKGKFIEVNPAFIKIFGYDTKEEILRLNVSDLYQNTEDRFSFNNRLIEKGFVRNEELFLKRKDGSLINCLVSASVVRDSKESIIFFDGIIEDITERKKAEKALRKSDEIHRSLVNDVLNTSALGIFILDFDFRIMWVNQTIESYFGFRSEDVLGKDKRQLISERISHIFENPESFVEKVFATYDNNTYIEEFECHVLPGRDRKERWLFHMSQPIQSGLYAGGRIELYTDITKRKQAEERLKLIAQVTTDLIYEWDIQTNTLKWFGDLDGVLGYQSGEIPRTIEAWIKLIHPDDRYKLSNSVEQHRKSTEPIEEEYRVQNKDGSWGYWSDKGIPILDIDGIPLKWIGGCSDITERKQAEQINLRLSETIRNARDGIILTTPKGRITFVNPAFEKMSGYKPSELLNTDPANLIINEDTTDIGNEIRYAVKETGEWKRELYCKRKNGEIYPIETRVFAIKNANGELVEIAAIQQDITERKQAENALKDSEYNYRILFDNISDGIFVLDAETMKVVLANKAVAEMYGIDSEDDIANLNPIEFILPEYKEEAFRIIMEDMFKKDLRQINEFRSITKDGRKIWISAVGVKTEYQGRLAGLISIRDITERKQIEEALKENEERYREIFQFSPDSIIIHDMDMNIIAVNNKAVEEFGYSKEELLEKTIYELHPETELKHSAQVLATMKKKEMLKVETKFIRKDSSVFWAEAIPCKYTLGGKQIIHVVIRDITERKQAENKLKNSEREKSVILDSSPTLIAYQNMEHEIIWVNQTACDSVNKKFDELIGRKCHEIWEGKKEVCKGCPVDEAWKTRKIVRGEHTTSDGRCWSIIGSPVIDDQGKIIGAVETSLDITERKQAEETLKKKMNELEIFNDAAVDREIIVNEQRKEINELLKKLGKEPKYDIVF